MIGMEKNGGPAFPFEVDQVYYYGMTLRDYFTAKAMQAMTAGSWPDANDRTEIAERAYAMADDMLKERAK